MGRGEERREGGVGREREGGERERKREREKTTKVGGIIKSG